MNIEIKLTKKDIQTLVAEELQRRLGQIPFDDTKVFIETKSAQNYKAEWETAELRVTYNISSDL